jgi:hypothetical protein
VEVGSITGVRVLNGNGEFEVLGIDLSSLTFDDVKATLTIKNKADFAAALPSLGQLEDTQTVSGEFTVGANGQVDLPWAIGDQTPRPVRGYRRDSRRPRGGED